MPHAMQPGSMSSSDEAQAGDTEGNANGTYAERRKSSKPIMEKRRRARINSSLDELKSILLEALKKDSTRHSKLEKADILEMTVKYLKNVVRQQRLTVPLSKDPSVVDKYQAGFSECRNEVMRFLSTCEGVTVDVRTRLLNHLASCIHSIQNQASDVLDDALFEPLPPMQRRVLSNGISQTAPVQVPEVVPQFKSGAYSVMPNTTLPYSTSGLDSKLAVVGSEISRGATGSLILQEVPQINPAINGFRAGNIAFLVPSVGAGTPTALLTQLPSISSQEKPNNLPSITRTEANMTVVDKTEEKTVASLKAFDVQTTPATSVFLNVGGSGTALSHAALGIQGQAAVLNLLGPAGNSQTGIYHSANTVGNVDMNTSLSSNDEQSIASGNENDNTSALQEQQTNLNNSNIKLLPGLSQQLRGELHSGKFAGSAECASSRSQSNWQLSPPNLSNKKRVFEPNLSSDNLVVSSLESSQSSPKRICTSKRESQTIFTHGQAAFIPSILLQSQNTAPAETFIPPTGLTAAAETKVTASVNFLPILGANSTRDFNNNDSSKKDTDGFPKDTMSNVNDHDLELTRVAAAVKSNPWRPWSKSELIDM
ncbi:unnamed protein product [Clavelina lepadiformis]|uniref:Uncharacterized protein n=3 Tax=Clavelina lepadiformis TaxID=159417 RepID=A0ABP0H352_CLALP